MPNDGKKKKPLLPPFKGMGVGPGITVGPAPVLTAVPNQSPVPRVDPSLYFDKADEIRRDHSYDPMHGITGGDFGRYSDLVRQSQPAQTAEELRAALAEQQMRNVLDRNRRMDSIEAPQEEQYTPPPFPELSIPEIPQRGKPKVDGATALIAGLAGLLAPQHAGQLGAAPYQAGLQENDREFEEGQQRYAMELKQRVMAHEQELERRNSQVRHDLMNRDTRYKNTAANIHAAMQKAQRDAEAGELGGTAAALRSFDTANAPSRSAGVSADLLKEEMRLKGERGEKAERRADSYTQAGIKAMDRQNADELRQRMQEDRQDFQEYMKKNYPPAAPFSLTIPRTELGEPAYQAANRANAIELRKSEKAAQATEAMKKQKRAEQLDAYDKELSQVRNDLARFNKAWDDTIKSRDHKGSKARNKNPEWHRLMKRKQELEDSNPRKALPGASSYKFVPGKGLVPQ